MTVRSARRAASRRSNALGRRATDSTAVLIGRIGFAARGAVYLMVGWLALQAAVGLSDSATDNQGALEAIGQQPGGLVLLGVVALGLFAYTAWSLVRAVFDPERLGRDAQGLAARTGYAVAGFSYAALAFAAARLALGADSAGRGSDAATQDWTARLLNAPFGPPLVIAFGVTMLVVAAAEFMKAFTADFRKDLNLHGVGSDQQRWIVNVGRMGLSARGIVFALIGVFLIQASRHDDASQAVGSSGALQKIAELPHGEIMLGLVAVGLFMYGLHSFVEARYRRLVPSR